MSAIRDEVKSIGKHSMTYVVGQALSRAVGFFMLPVYTRFISPAGYGALDLIELLASIVALTIAMGVADTMSRFYYAEKDDARRNLIVSTIVIGLAVVAVPVVLLALGISGFLARTVLDAEQYQLCLQIGIATAWFGLLCEIGYSYLRMRYMARSFVTLTLVQLALALSLNIWFIVFLELDIMGIVLSTIITQSIVGTLLTVTILRNTGVRFSPGLFARAAKFGLPLVPSRIGWTAGFASNRVMLRWFGSTDPAVALVQVGIFSLGSKFAVIVNRFVNVPFNSFWGPRRLELVAREDAQSRQTVARICTYATFVSMFAVLMLCAGIEPVVRIIADPRYYGAHTVVPFIALTYAGLGLEPHLTTGMLYRGKTMWLTWISVFALAIALLWNWLLIPRFGLLGAATSNLAATAVREVLIYAASQRIYRIPFELRRIATLLLTASALYLVCGFVTFESPCATLLARGLIASTYPLMLVGVRFYEEEELRHLGGLLRRGPGTVLRAFSSR